MDGRSWRSRRSGALVTLVAGATAVAAAGCTVGGGGAIAVPASTSATTSAPTTPTTTTSAPVTSTTTTTTTPPTNTSTATSVPRSPTTTANPQPNGQIVDLTVPPTASGFTTAPAKVWLPPQYFSDPTRRFPVVLLGHGNPGDPTNWFGAPRADTTGLAVAQSGTPVILVMPQVLRNPTTDDSLCLDTVSQGNAETYLTKDVVAAVDSQLRTIADARHRGIGGLSMSGYCALNLGLKHPDLFSVVLDFAGETTPTVDSPGLTLASVLGVNWQQKAAANDPTTYVSTLDGSKGPAIWFDVGASDSTVLAQMTALAPKLRARGYTVELHTRPGGHDFPVWGSGLAEALPWAAKRFSL